VDPGRPILLRKEVITVRAYYYIALAVLVLCGWLVHSLRTGGIGRVLVSIRDNEDVARAFGINSTARKLQAFVVSGTIAGLGGVVLAQSLSRLTIATFPAVQSVALLAMVVLGGINRVSGAVLGAVYLVGLPLLISIPSLELMMTGVGVLIFVLYVPGGLSQLLDQVRLLAVRMLARRAGVEDELPANETPELGRLSFVRENNGKAPASDKTQILTARAITLSYDHVKALDDMSLEVLAGETLGIIGPNGSGKTTLFKVISGFEAPQAGIVTFGGRDLTRLGPATRSRLGLVRSFQDSMLFPTLTVLESVRLAFEGGSATRLVSSVLGLPPARHLEREKEERARGLVDLMGLSAFRDKFVGELSTGTRRITELCCLIALEPKVLLLDEPSSGIAQRETEALGELLGAIKDRMGLTLVVIEHDMPLIMAISDRIIAMASGSKISEGAPSEIQSDGRVIESYLGTFETAIARSGATPAKKKSGSTKKSPRRVRPGET
ncbi:MAG: ATP-binding cassette domain-containing protein, partial [Acidimicrobiia bacterium]